MAQGSLSRAVVVLAGASLAMPLFVSASRASDLGASSEQALDLFQKIARAEVVVRVKTYDGTLRYAIMDVVEVLKGPAPPVRIRVAFREFNFQRPPGVESILFPNGQEELLFLSPYAATSERKKRKNSDLFILFRGAEGRIALPAEGAASLLEAVRRLAGLTERDPVSQMDGLGRMLEESNLLLVESALDEIGRLKAASPQHYSRLIRLLINPSPRLRIRSLKLLAIIFPSGTEAATDEIAVEQGEGALAAVLERAHNDPDTEVRVEAVAAAAAWPDRKAVDSALKAIAQDDPAQAVRYEAQRALFRRQAH